jgi:DNA polymerase
VRLIAEMRGCTRCPVLAATRTQVVVGQTPPGARLLVVGEAPGAQEDLLGEPFVGRSGKLLDRLLEEVGLPRREVAVLNTVKCRPPGNRVPTRAETEHCRPWLEAQLVEVAPVLVVSLGLSATGWFLGRVTLGDVRGRVHEAGAQRVLPTYHPAAALRGGPDGEPLRLLREDLALAARLAA